MVGLWVSKYKTYYSVSKGINPVTLTDSFRLFHVRLFTFVLRLQQALPCVLLVCPSLPFSHQHFQTPFSNQIFQQIIRGQNICKWPLWSGYWISESATSFPSTALINLLFMTHCQLYIFGTLTNIASVQQ